MANTKNHRFDRQEQHERPVPALSLLATTSGSDGDRPLNFPQYHRVEKNGKVGLLINEGNGWIICHESGQWVNPWTKVPFTQLRNAANVIRFYFRHGFIPGHRRPVEYA